MTNLNHLAKEIAKKDDGNINLNIAEIKRVIKLMSIEMYDHPELIAKLITNGKKHALERLPKLPDTPPAFLFKSKD